MVLLSAILFLLFLILDQSFPLDFQLLGRPLGKIYLDHEDRVLREELARDQRFRFKVELSSIQERHLQALIRYEDQYFYYHPGVNPFSLLRALIFNLRNTRKIGGSTLTMQVARMLEKRERNLWSKLIEIFRALQLEWHLEKSEILSVYFHIAPYGGNLEGIQAASRLYFRKKLRELSLREILYLTVLPRNPNGYRPNEKGFLKDSATTQMRILREKLCKNSSDPECLSPITEFKVRRRRHLDLASHATRRAGIPIRSSIDITLQKKLESFSRELADRNPTNHKDVGAFIAEWRTSRIRAYTGSPDFLDGSQIDALQIPRSPGSLYKPFLYAMALDQGLIRPKSMVLDIEYHFGQYKPANLRSKSHGMVRSEDALNLSLNPPAVLLQSRLSDGGLYSIFKGLGLGRKGMEADGGLSIALGGKEITLLQMGSLYAALLNRGLFQNLHLEVDEKHEKSPISLFSEEASILTRRMLFNNLPMKRAYANREGWIFKTGTSSYYRDLWIIAANDTYLVGVWLGSLDYQEGSMHFAQQVLYDPVRELLFSLGGKPLSREYLKHPGIKEVETCQDHILFNEKNCRLKVPDFKIRGVQENPCAILEAESLVFLRRYLEPADWEGLIQRCGPVLEEIPPKITWPGEGSVIVPNQASVSRVLSQCFSSQKDQSVFYFLNQKHLGTYPSGKAVELLIPPGTHTLLCSDSSALSRQIEFEVQKGKI